MSPARSAASMSPKLSSPLASCSLIRVTARASSCLCRRSSSWKRLRISLPWSSTDNAGLSRIRSNSDVRDQLLQVGNIGFDSVNVGMRVGQRRTTLSVQADRVPYFTYVLKDEPTETLFYQEVSDMVMAVAPSLGIPLGQDWKDKPWSSHATDRVIEVQPEEVSRDVGEHE